MSDQQESKHHGRWRAGASVLDERTVVPRVLARGINRLPKDVVLLSQRSRLVEATAHRVAEKGYVNTTVADIISHAGVSRTTFYQQFEDKEACFLFCYNRLSRSHLDLMAEAFQSQLSAPRKLVLALRVYLERLADDGVYSTAFFAEASSVGGQIEAARDARRAEVIDYLQAWYREAILERPTPTNSIPPAVFELVLDGASAYLVRLVRARQTESLPERTAELAFFFFSALGLHDWAQAAMQDDKFD